MSLGNDHTGNQNTFKYNARNSESPYRRIKAAITQILPCNFSGSWSHPAHSFPLLLCPVSPQKPPTRVHAGARNATPGFGFPGHQKITLPISQNIKLPDCSCRDYS